jgi:hypothetical protein
MVILQTRALFTKLPRVFGEIANLTAVKNLKPIKIEKTIALSGDDYDNFITDMTVERQFLKNNSYLCRIDDEGIWHCLLVVRQGHHQGILVMANEVGFLDYAALFWEKNEMHAQPPLQKETRGLYSFQQTY